MAPSFLCRHLGADRWPAHYGEVHARRPSRVGPAMRVGGLLLAAGAGRRLGQPKALVPFDGQLLVERGVALLTGAGCAPVHVVLGAAYDEILVTADLAEATPVHNPAWASGMGSSLRTGLASLSPEVEAVVVALVDQPLVTAAAVRRLLTAYQEGATVAVATYDGQPRNPVLLGRAVWAEVAALAEGDLGARAYLRAHPELLTQVPCDDVGSPDDVDTPQDLATLRERKVAGS
ncbi:nucleotidyltransferase family protein [Actinopolymorpha alba]|uniref:nucleotidyltransferase family protein n=1 Tax=Actinopolymorpha alba TaxID=533267 RepID=UPI0003A0E40C|nr:nucleotidyltransferase family protein [Actinopolymorpha alba]